MVIAIDFFKQIKGVGKSIGIYNVTFNLINEISKVYKKYQGVEIVVFCNKYNVEDIKESNLKLIVVDNLDPKNKIHCVFWELFYVNKLLKKHSVDVVLFPRGFTSIHCPAKDVVLIHDMIPFYYDEYYHKYLNVVENFYIMNRLKYTIKHAKHVITISHESKKQILKYVKTDANKISVIYNGMKEINIGEGVPCKKNYISAITSTLPHKNAIGIIRSYERYVQTSADPLDLTIVGITKDDIADISPEVVGKITFKKYISSDYELYKTIQESELFIFLSFAEGFGIPPLEAMRLSTPVICSNLSSLPEVVGDAAILVNPNNYDEVSQAIDKVLSDDALSNELIKKGIKNVARFKPEDQISQYMDILVNIHRS